MVRLPIPGGDDGDWGDILNEYLQASHNADGTLKDDSVGTSNIEDASITNAKLATNPLARANHTGTQLASTISDFSNAVTNTNVEMASVVFSWTFNGNGNGSTVTVARMTGFSVAGGGPLPNWLTFANGNMIISETGLYRVEGLIDFPTVSAATNNTYGFAEIYTDYQGFPTYIYPSYYDFSIMGLNFQQNSYYQPASFLLAIHPDTQSYDMYNSGTGILPMLVGETGQELPLGATAGWTGGSATVAVTMPSVITKIGGLTPETD